MKFIFAAILISMSVSPPSKASDAKVCGKYSSNQDCLVNNFSELYHSDYKLFFNTVHGLEAEAKKCKSKRAMILFAELLKFIEGNAEVGEYFSEEIEIIFVKKPKCILDVVDSLSAASNTKLFSILRTPTFQNADAILKALNSQQKHKNYNEAHKGIFGK